MCLILLLAGIPAQAYLSLHDKKRPRIKQEIENDQEYLFVVKLMKECWAEERKLRPSFPNIMERLSSIIKQYDSERIIQVILPLYFIILYFPMILIKFNYKLYDNK